MISLSTERYSHPLRPNSVLFNLHDRFVREYIRGKKDEKFGEFVGSKAIVKAVISLPADTFKLSGTGANTSFMCLQKRHARDDNPEQFLSEPQTCSWQWWKRLGTW